MKLADQCDVCGTITFLRPRQVRRRKAERAVLAAALAWARKVRIYDASPIGLICRLDDAVRAWEKARRA